MELHELCQKGQPFLKMSSKMATPGHHSFSYTSRNGVIENYSGNTIPTFETKSCVAYGLLV